MINLAQVVGIIAEYHPFHNGHLYQMRNARALTGASYCVVFLSSYFVQRGMPAIYSPLKRAEAAPVRTPFSRFRPHSALLPPVTTRPTA